MVTTRFAPSPTGYLHIGGVRTALFSWAYARSRGGKFLLRVEDTDTERNTEESVRTILDGMKWLGLANDGDVTFQSKRMDRYKAAIARLVESGAAYPCYCSKEELDQKRAEAAARKTAFLYDGKWRPEPGKTRPPIPQGVDPVIRMKMPREGSTVWNDAVKGLIEIPNKQLDDIIIARSDGAPTYNFCVVVDDSDMGVTHVIRGDDHVNNTPKQINIFKAMGLQPPVFAHLPMIFNKQGKKMSKRGGDTVAITEFERLGFLPEAILNYLARLGWSHGDDEIFSMEQFVEWFDLKDVNPSPSRFDMDKLRWYNHHYMRQADHAGLADEARRRLAAMGVDDLDSKPFDQIVELVRDRASDFEELARHCLYFYRRQTPTQKEIDKSWQPEDRERMARLRERIAALPSFDKESLGALFASFCESEGVKMKKVGVPMRLAVCGVSVTPGLEDVLLCVGRDETLARMDQPLV